MNAQISEQQNTQVISQPKLSELTLDMRILIQRKLELGMSCNQIAKDLMFNSSSIIREVKRFPAGEYNAYKAQEQRDAKVRNRVRKSKLTPEIRQIIIEQMEKGRTPEQIANTVLKGKVSHQAIYYWINTKKLIISRNLLVRKGKNPRAEEYRGKLSIPDKNTIGKRDEVINLRKSFGHWEIDTVNPARGKGKGCVLTLVERLTRFYVTYKMPDRTASSVLEAVTKFVEEYGTNVVKSITADRGKEFACFKEIEALGPRFFFCTPYSPQERGSNENANGLLRRYYPKGSSFEHVTQEELDRVMEAINTIPKKLHGFKTTKEIFSGYKILAKLIKKNVELIAKAG